MHLLAQHTSLSCGRCTLWVQTPAKFIFYQLFLKLLLLQNKQNWNAKLHPDSLKFNFPCAVQSSLPLFVASHGELHSITHEKAEQHPQLLPCASLVWQLPFWQTMEILPRVTSGSVAITAWSENPWAVRPELQAMLLTLGLLPASSPSVPNAFWAGSHCTLC